MGLWRRFLLERLIPGWHRRLALQQYPKSWHRNDIRAEMTEYRQLSATERSCSVAAVSELSDVLFTSSRAHSAGHAVPHVSDKFSTPVLSILTCYMIVKYSLRYALY